MYASDTSHPARSRNTARALRACYGAAALGLAAAAVAVATGLAFLLVAPAEGSTSEVVLAGTAAVSGIASAVLLVSALILAQAFGLWAYVPTRVRAAATALIVAGLVLSIARSLI